MSIVLQYDSRQKVTYAYHNDVTWDSKQKRSHQKRTLIGKIDPETSLIVRTSGSRRKNIVDEAVIAQEIETYNNSKRKKNNDIPEDETHGLEAKKYDELIAKYDEIKAALISFSETIQSIYGK